MSRPTALPENPNLTLVIGGARSGKSRHGEELITAHQPPWVYVATAEARDDEMRARVEAHRARRDQGWHTVEAPLDLIGALNDLPPAQPILIDCLTLWLTNQMIAGNDLNRECQALTDALAAYPTVIVVVSNEIGLGIVPADAMSRRFRDAAGRLNQMVAAIAGRVDFMVAGIAMQVK